jgi:hypothetical protein
MRLLILAAAATLFITGTAMAAQHHHHQHHAANAPVAAGSVPADTLSAHDLYIKNLHDSGYNPAADKAPN